MVETQAGFWLVLALMLLLFPVQVTIGVMLAAVIHELGHILTIRLSGGRIRRLVLRPGGAILETDSMEPGQELLCALAGPAAGAIGILFWRYHPELAMAAIVQTVFNLLPVYPLDGGRAMRSAMEMCNLRIREGIISACVMQNGKRKKNRKKVLTN